MAEDTNKQKEIAVKSEETLLKKQTDPSYKALLEDKNTTGQFYKQLGTSDKRIKNLQRILDDDEKIRKSIKRLDPDRRKKEKPSMTDQLIGALMYLTPQLLGMAIGGAMEGEAGAVAGYKGAIAGQKGMIDAQAQQQDMYEQGLDIERKEQAIATGPEQETLSPGERLRAEQFMASHEQRDARERRLKAQQDKSLVERKRSNDLREEALRRYTPEQQKELTSLIVIDEELGKIEDIIDSRDLDTGEFIGALKDMAIRYGFSDDMEHAAVMAKAAMILTEQLRAYSGTAVNEGEVKRWQAILMTARAHPELFRTRLQQFRDFINGKGDVIIGVAGFYGGQFGWRRAKQPDLESPFETMKGIKKGFKVKRAKGVPKSSGERVKDKGLDISTLSDEELDKL